ncbi:uncharacterized protein LOC119591022 [Penaeus monodon]|uniref:uncharacterized protein LOC119591022 n=1 Tax=Penaeus monodon TaxID=6687 RepID=UPI0018A6DFD4|nr:uncharacterized protein LOC119591022 [Penaeus monodon]
MLEVFKCNENIFVDIYKETSATWFIFANKNSMEIHFGITQAVSSQVKHRNFYSNTGVLEQNHIYPYEWLAEWQPKGNQVTEDVDGFPERESQDGKQNYVKFSRCHQAEGFLKYKTCQTVCEDPFENIITILSTQHSLMLDDNFTLDGPDQALACMQVMFRLGETIYEATTKDVKRQTDPDTLQKEHSKTKKLNRFLGLLQHILIPKAEQDCQASVMNNIMKMD